MIYAKVFLYEENKETYIVTETPTINVDEKYCLLAGNHINKYGDTYNITSTRILSASNVAISKEAKEKLLELLSFTNKNKVAGIFCDDFAFEKYRVNENKYDGEFAFYPDKGTPNKKVFNVKNEIVINFTKLNRDVMNYMQVYDNEVLKNLDITEPIDEHKMNLR